MALPALLPRVRAAFVLFFIVLLPAPLIAQAADDLPWLYERSDVPVDRSWTYGVLSNGVRYAVKRNGVPPNQVAIRVRMDVGSLMEQDQERGYAHFLEHLSFRGSEYVPDGEAIRIWQRFGATFGSDNNAETTPTQTVYKLDLPDANRASLDESMKILSGMIRKPNITAGALAAEKAIVLAEMQDRAGPQREIAERSRAHFFQGQLLAERLPIGSPETLTGATVDSVRAFHRRWYRPENAVIAIAGDVDPALLEEMVKKHFSSWRVAGQGALIPDFGAPAKTDQVAEILVEPTTPRTIALGWLRPWEQVDDTIAYNQQILIDLVARRIVNRRLEARARSGASFVRAYVDQQDVSRSADTTNVYILPLGDDWQAAVREVRGIIADALATPPSQEDIARELAGFEKELAVGVETYPAQPGGDQADNVVNAVDIRETIASPQTALDVFNAMQAMYTPDRLLASTRAQFTANVTRAFMTSPTPMAGADTQLASLLAENVAPLQNARVEQEAIDFSALRAIGAPGTVVAESKIGDFGIERLRLSNGVRAILYPNTGEKNRIHVNVRFGTGFDGAPADKLSPLWSGDAALVESGIADFGQEELDRLVSGRQIGMGFGVDDDAFEFTAITRPADLRDQLHLIAAKLVYPRWDTAPVERAKAELMLANDQFLSNPAYLLERDLDWLLRSRDLRWQLPEDADIAALTPEQFRAFWEPRLQSGPVEVLIFGDFEREAAIEALLGTFGAMPERAAPAAATAAPVFPNVAREPAVLRHRGDANSAAAVLAWPTASGIAKVREGRRLKILSDIFQYRLFNRLRESEGSSYSPFVVSYWSSNFDRIGHLRVQSLLAPDKIDRLFTTARTIAGELKSAPVDDDELQRAIEPTRQAINRAISGNLFWMGQLEGASFDDNKVRALSTLYADYLNVDAVEIQAMAQKYLVDSQSWELVVLPENVEWSGSDSTGAAAAEPASR